MASQNDTRKKNGLSIQTLKENLTWRFGLI